jgi:serine/threonine-protein kinase
LGTPDRDQPYPIETRPLMRGSEYRSIARSVACLERWYADELRDMATRIPSSRSLTSATTRVEGTSARTPRLLQVGQVIDSPETSLQFRIDRLVGAGGFGEAYLSRRLGRSSEVPEVVCIKASARMDGWLREAYFGRLLDGHPRAVRLFDAFPIVHENGRMLYCLVLEYARHGDLSMFLARGGSRWTEAAVRREMAGVLEVLVRLHRGHNLHRDLTPMNVFVCDGPRLKLGDFGIVRQQGDRRGVTARTMNALTAPSEFLDGVRPKWQARDDVYQVGQLLAMLVKGDARARIQSKEVRGLACGDHLKEIVYRCIGERRKRYESADELIEALRHAPAALRPGVLRSLTGVHLAFTGILTRPRKEAMLAAKRAGAIVHGSPSGQTTVVVRGRPNVLQAAGKDGGVKLMEIKRLRERGHQIKLVNEAQFWRLVQ